MAWTVIIFVWYLIQKYFLLVPTEVDEYQQSDNATGIEYQQPENETRAECNGLFLDQEQLTRSSSTSDIRDQCNSDVFQGNLELSFSTSCFKCLCKGLSCLVWNFHAVMPIAHFTLSAVFKAQTTFEINVEINEPLKSLCQSPILSRPLPHSALMPKRLPLYPPGPARQPEISSEWGNMGALTPCGSLAALMDLLRAAPASQLVQNQRNPCLVLSPRRRDRTWLKPRLPSPPPLGPKPPLAELWPSFPPLTFHLPQNISLLLGCLLITTYSHCSSCQHRGTAPTSTCLFICPPASTMCLMTCLWQPFAEEAHGPLVLPSIRISLLRCNKSDENFWIFSPFF